MLTTEECMALLNEDEMHFERIFSLDCQMNTLQIAANNLTLTLNESQKRLMICLLKKINCKRKIINIVWYENHQRISDNNYHQLIFQMRALLQRHQLSGKLLVTVPYYGVKMNDNLWRSLPENNITTPEVPDSEAPKKKSLLHTLGNRLTLLFCSVLSVSLLSLWLE